MTGGDSAAPWGRFWVAGIPVTQGSKTAFVTRDKKRAVMREGGSETARASHAAWRHAVATEARALARSMAIEAPLVGPLVLDLIFRLPKPATAPKRRRTWPIGARSGDIDKLSRAVLDALTGVLIGDDSQVVGLVAWKDYHSQPGLLVSLWPVEVSTDGSVSGLRGVIGGRSATWL